MTTKPVSRWPSGATRRTWVAPRLTRRVHLGVQRFHRLGSLQARGRADVEVYPVLDGLALRYLLEEEPRSPFAFERQRGRAAVAHFGRGSPGPERLVPTGETGRRCLHPVAENLAPESGQYGWVGAVECDLDLSSVHVLKLSSETARANACVGQCVKPPQLYRPWVGARFQAASSWSHGILASGPPGSSGLWVRQGQRADADTSVAQSHAQQR